MQGTDGGAMLTVLLPVFLNQCKLDLASRMRFSSLVLKNLTRRPLRTSLTLLAFSAAIAAVVALIGIARGFTKSFSGVYESHSVDIVVSRQGSADRLSSSVDEAFEEKIRAIPGVDNAAGVLLETLSFEEQGVYGIPTMGIRTDSWLRDDYRWRERAENAESENPESASSVADQAQVSLGVNLADRLGVGIGGSVSLFEEPYLVAGIFESSSAWENGSMIMPLEQLQLLTDRNGQVTYINVVLRSDATVESAKQISEEIQQLDRRLLALTTDEFVQTDTRMQIAGAMAWMTSMIAVVIGAIGTLNTMMTSVMERTREIGILRAVGWPSRRVTWMILLESLVLAIVSVVLGSLLAILLTWILSLSPSVRGILTPVIDLPVLLQGAVLGLTIGLLGAILPARRASRMMPTEAFRPW
ncbi:Macrolide export ATP-binding/permease protein MacB [Stieleria varia]|uniref:Macrolide export ATP-binding/permease protein MacB n=2 Tax=Stieleria varia TaxID=2528005 RepID=A0A5C6A1M2_9BACT|nr:Macrolide export ATP-binding/permease protein MacB [Stieleria varia]